MPYIKAERREAVDSYLNMIRHEGDCFASDYPQDCGELNYAFTMTCLTYTALKYNLLDERLAVVVLDYLHDKPLRYQRINDVAGALECAALEMERRRPAGWSLFTSTLRAVFIGPYADIAAPYELTKIGENGDIAEYGSPTCEQST